MMASDAKMLLLVD